MPPEPRVEFTVSSLVPLPPSEVFPTLVDELSTALGGADLRLEPGRGGRLIERGPDGRETEVARVVEWDPGRGVVLRWHPPSWETREATRMEIRLEPEEEGTRVTVTHRGWHPLGNREPQGEELVGWFAQEVASTLLKSSSPRRLGDWITDRMARRPSGARSRATYRDPMFHRPNFGLLLEGLQLSAGDRLLEVGCGGGAFLKDALESGCSAAAVDHSPELLKVAAEQNEDAVASGRLTLLKSEADALPFPDRSFTAAVMTGVLGFLPDAPATFREIHRALRPGGRFAVFAGTKELAGTPAAPYPIAGRVHWYEDRELADLARGAGFTEVRVLRPKLEKYARQAGLPPEVVAFFREGGGAQVLWARRPLAAGPAAPRGRARSPARKRATRASPGKARSKGRSRLSS